MTQTRCALPKRARHQYIQHKGGTWGSKPASGPLDFNCISSSSSGSRREHFSLLQLPRDLFVFPPMCTLLSDRNWNASIHNVFSKLYTLFFTELLGKSHLKFILFSSYIRWSSFFFLLLRCFSAVSSKLFIYFNHSCTSFFSNLELWFLNEGSWSFQEKGCICVGWFEIIPTLS